MIPGAAGGHLAAVDAQERAREPDVLAAGQLLVEAGAEGQQARDLAVDVDRRLPTAG